MQIPPFILEQYFAKYEFTAKYMLSSSDCDGYPMEYILNQADPDELAMWNSLKLGYTEGYGSPVLREAICRFYTKAKPENVLVASPGELSFIMMNVIVEQQKGRKPHAVVISPAYQSLYQVLKSLDCDISYWLPEDGKYNVDMLESLVRDETCLIVINFPHNPTGAYITPEELDRIVEIARSNDAYLYSDEMYRDLILKDECEKLPAVCDLYEKGISLWGMAKSFGLAGLRIGWFVSQDRGLLSKIQSFKDYLSICCSAPSEVLSTIALNHAEKFIEPNVQKIKDNILYFKRAVEAGKLPFVKSFTEPLAGSVAFVEIEPAEAAYLLDAAPATALEFSNAIVEKYGIMTVPAPMFENPGNYLRIGFGRENFKEVIDMLCVK